MIFTRPNIQQKLEQVFDRRQAEVLAEVVEIAYCIMGIKLETRSPHFVREKRRFLRRAGK